MKKVLSLVLALMVCVAMLAACGGDASSPAPVDPAPATSSAPAPAPTPSSDPEPAFDLTQNISVTAREDGSGTKSAFMELVGLKDMPDPAGVIIQTGTAAILTEVANNPTAIAYESLGYVTDEVKMLTVGGVEATIENIQTGDYAISRPLSVVYHEATLDDALNKAFFDYLMSSDAQAIIAAEGYVSMAEGEAYVMNGDLSGTIDVSGSTSLQPLMTILAEEFQAIQTNVTVNVSGGGSGTGYANAEEGVSAFGMISEVFNQEKAPSCVSSMVCKDGIAVIVNPENPLTDITVEQLNGIYNAEAGDAAITTWEQLA